MKNIQCVIKAGVLIVALCLFFSGCTTSTNPDGKDSTETAEIVPILPNVGTIITGTAATSMRAATATEGVVIDTTQDADDPRNTKSQLILVDSVLLGVSSNASSYKVGDSYTSLALGRYPVTTVISKDGDNVIFTGTFCDGASYYKMTVHPDKSFLFEQKIKLIVKDSSDAITTTIFVKVDMSNASYTSDTSLEGDSITRYIQTLSGKDTWYGFYMKSHIIAHGSNFGLFVDTKDMYDYTMTGSGDIEWSNTLLSNAVDAIEPGAKATSLAAGTIYQVEYNIDGWNGFNVDSANTSVTYYNGSENVTTTASDAYTKLKESILK